MNQLVWLRTDLRAADNTALTQALAQGPTIAVYLLTPQQWAKHDDAPCKIDFWRRNLFALRAELQKLNIPLLIMACSDWLAMPDTLRKLCQKLQIRAVHCNTEYGIHETQRDTATSAMLAAEGIVLHSYLDQIFFMPGSIRTQAGQLFQVYSQFRKVCVQRLYTQIPACLPYPKAQAPMQPDSLPADALWPEHPESAHYSALWPAGEAAAQRRLTDFAAQQLVYYKEQRDIPALPGTSQLSAYLAAGVISPRQCLHAALQANQGAFETGNPGVVQWVNELLWREFYKHILVGYPRVSRHRAFRTETEALPWREAPDDLAAWKAGRTGIPLVDAGMRQLLATGWMHNRLRMVTAMFLSKNLLIDWRIGEQFFMQHLIDGDLAANNGGWQWSASTGTDAAPYFRLFNPLSQAARFDPQGSFIRYWVPELSNRSDTELHQLNEQPDLLDSSGYPRAIVDLSASRERVLEVFKNLPKNLPEYSDV